MLKKLLITGVLINLSQSFLLAASGPDVSPFRQVGKTARQEPAFTVKTFNSNGITREQASFSVGGKKISVREANGRLTDRNDNTSLINLYIDNREYLSIKIAGGYKGNFGFPFATAPGTKPEFRIDQTDKTITYLKKYLLPDNSTATFSYVLKSLGDSKVALNWDLGIPPEKQSAAFKKLSSYVSIILMNYRNGKILVNNQLVKQNPKADLLKKVSRQYKNSTHYAPLYATKHTNIKSLTLDVSAKPESQVSIHFPHPFSGALQERVMVSGGNKTFSMLLHARPDKQRDQDELIIDLGAGAIPKPDIPPPVGGIDFYNHDRLHVPQSPTRNLMPNPDFEQGLRYWTWMYGGAKYNPGEDRKRYVINDKEAKFGRKSLLINPGGSSAALSFPLPLKTGTTYTVSCYAKAARPGATLQLCPMSISTDGQFRYGEQNKPAYNFKLDNEWQRYSFTFKQQAGANCIRLGGRNTIVDGIQVEVGKVPTPFVAPPVEGLLTTSDRDNNIESGKAINAEFHLFGQPGTSGKLELKVFNFYQETLFNREYAFKSGDVIKLPWTETMTGTGIFIVRAKFTIPGVKPYYDYYRFSVMKFPGDYPIRKFYTNLMNLVGCISRSDDYAKNIYRWGFGTSSGSAPNDAVLKKNNIAVPFYFTWRKPPLKGLSKDDLSYIMKHIYYADKITPEDEKRLEAMAYSVVKNNPDKDIWYFFNESECKNPLIKAGKYDEWAKAQLAFYRGARRASPHARLLPDKGTSGFNPLRGRKELEGYLKATSGKAKWDIIAVHPYGSIDGSRGTYDLDAETQYLIKLMQKYGYDKNTSIMFTELGGIPSVHVPEWGPWLKGTKPGYDLGNQEYLQACLIARIFLIGLKFRPQLEMINIWTERLFMDQYLTPYAVAKAVNTLGTLFKNPQYVADVKPARGVRGYVFKEAEKGIAALWCVNDRVENGYEKGPVMQIKLDGLKPELIDLMGNRRTLEIHNDTTELQLSPAPLFLHADNPALLVKVLQNSEVTGAGSNITVSFLPEQNGSIAATITNISNRSQSGSLRIMDKTVDFKLNGGQKVSRTVDANGADTGKMYHFDKMFKLTMGAKVTPEKNWNMQYFYASQVSGKPDWSKIPGLEISNRHYTSKTQSDSNFHANFKVAYDRRNLYLRVECRKPDLLIKKELFASAGIKQNLYRFDGSLEVYLDTGADGLSNTSKGYDINDYRYDFSMGGSDNKSVGWVYRLQDVDAQLAGGTEFPSKADAARGIPCKFIRTKGGFAYEIIFPQKFIEPFVLQPGSRAGFGLYIHNRIGSYNLSMATEKGAHCNFRPDLWPIIVLK